MEIILSLAIALLGGLLMSRLAKLLKLPAVTAYLVTGILVGPYVLGRLGVPGLGFVGDSVEQFGIIADVALGFIAFAIGNEFRVAQLKKIGKQATVIGILQAVAATILVDGALIGLHFAFPETLSIEAAIVLGAIASATAPAATLMVVKQYKAKGPVTETLLPVVALDDAVGLVIFAVSFGIAEAIGAGQVDVVSIVVNPLLEIVLSLALGAIMGILFSLTEKIFHSRSKRLGVSVGFVFLTIAISMLKFEIGPVHIGFSSLLACMMLGTVFCNICDFSENLMERVDRWAAPLFAVFFVISGAELKLDVFTNYIFIVIGVVYILARSVGKYTGSYASAKLMKCDKNIVNYLGITLLPQAGVALGMANQVAGMTAYGDIVLNITLFAVLIYELIGPLLTKISLQKAGEIDPEGRTSARHDRHRNKKHKPHHGRHPEHETVANSNE